MNTVKATAQRDGCHGLSLLCRDAFQGDQGEPGDKGMDGSPGVPGLPGEPGRDGVMGLKGEKVQRTLTVGSDLLCYILSD